MQETIVLVLEIIGTISFAISGAVTGVRKKMDIFGVVILGLVTAVGGGVIRDLILGITPPNTFKNPVYGIVAICVSLIIFIPWVRRSLNKIPRAFDLFILLTDSAGLSIFTVVGIQTAIESTKGFNVYLLVFVGVVTGVGGGVLRDVFVGDPPYIFVKHFYASASIIGAIVTLIMWNLAGGLLSCIAGALLILVLRLLAAHYHWNLPHPKSE